jgi:hypothetical protein
MSADAYVLLMIKQLSARGSLFLLVRTHHHLEYYFNLSDIRLAANEQSARTLHPQGGANVVNIRRAVPAGAHRPG